MNSRIFNFLTINDLIEVANEVTNLREACGRVGMSRTQFKKFAKTFKDPTTGLDFYELIRSRKNQGNKKTKYNRTVRKFPKPKALDLKLVTEGYRRNVLTENELKFHLISGGYKKQVCETCGFDSKRGVDYKVPLKLLFKDGKSLNGRLENLEFICYNCHFLHHPNYKIDDNDIYDTDVNNISTVKTTERTVVDTSLDIEDFEKSIRKIKREKKQEAMTKEVSDIDFNDPYAFVTNKKLI